MSQNTTIIQHLITGTDELPHLALKYLGDASLWKVITDYNNLNYPYITTDPNFQYSIKASGLLQLTRYLDTNELLIKKGTLFASPPTDIFPEYKYYESTKDVIISPGTLEAVVPVQCTYPGFIGNTLQNSINKIITTEYIGTFSKISNTYPFTNGVILNVKTIGDTLLIPDNGTIYTNPVGFITTDEYLNQVGGSDIELGSNGDMIVDNYGDICNVSGIFNIQQAVNHRLIVDIDEIPRHPEYGTSLSDLVGRPQSYVNKLMELAIRESLSYEDRIEEISSISIHPDKTALYITIDVKIINSGIINSLQVKLPY